MSSFSRRVFTARALGAITTYSLFDTLFRHDLFADEIKPIMSKWFKELHELGQDLKDQKLKQEDWQTKVEELYKEIDLPDVLRLIDFEKLSQGIKFADKGALSLAPKLPAVQGVPRELVFGKQVFALKKDRSVVPHGHNNMATAFLILKGELHGRHYDRLESHADHYVIKPSIDRAFAAGEYSTVSDFKDNIHWFKATSETAFIFNIHVTGVDPKNSEATGRLYLDPNGEKLANGLIKAPKLDYEEVNKRYG